MEVELARDQGVELADGQLRCVLQPSLGGCIAGMWFGGEPVLRSQPVVRSARDSANFPLVPFSNRIAGAVLRWGGSTYSLTRNFEPEPHAMHGIGWQRAWHPVRFDPRSAVLRLEHHGGADWPFDFACEQAFEVRDGELRVSLTLQNTGPAPMPAGVGWHPYVVKRPGAILRFRAASRWETDAQSLPVARVANAGIEARCDCLAVNHAYDGWDGTAVVEDGRFHVAITSDLPRLIASTSPAKDFIAVEPVSHVPDSFSRADPAMGTVALEPGETLRAQMAIRVLHKS